VLKNETGSASGPVLFTSCEMVEGITAMATPQKASLKHQRS